MTNNTFKHIHTTPGYPDRSPQHDARPGFTTPPPGYGEVPFWWWTGDNLDVDRMLGQVRELHAKGISGFQVNYSHLDTKGWPTDSGEPKLFTDAWWKVYGRISEECAKLNMGIGMSTYTIDWPNGAKNLFWERFYSRPELNAVELVVGERVRGKEGFGFQVSGVGCFAVRAYEVKNGVIQPGGVDLVSRIPHPDISWTAPAGEWEVWTFKAVRKEGSLNPMLPGSGATVIEGFYQEFENHNPGGGAKGLNFFFNDELEIGLGKFAWSADFAGEFKKRKGYDLFEVLPAMWEDIGDITPKVRIDYADVRMSLMEERYFEPIYNWHTSRGIIYGCDNHGRGLDPYSYGDYYRATRWYSAPGHDTPGGNADPIKGKVSSSIANLYQRPRVWLEGYHSLGWGATPERLMFATRENYLYGCNLFSLHGFYYTLLGSHWEWAPPCYHFRMPYWKHMGVFLKYFERLSYLMSQGHHVCDIAVIYPVTPYEAEMNGDAARDVAFEIGRKLLEAGMNYDFIDHQSVDRAVLQGGRLIVENANASYKALIFPNMEAVRWSNLEKAAAFTEAGGVVLSVGVVPSATDRAGRNDPALTALNQRAFKTECRLMQVDDIFPIIGKSFTPDFQGLEKTVRAMHRRIGPREVYMVMDAAPGAVVEFRAKGKAELWDPWTGDAVPLRVVSQAVNGTQVELPLEVYEAQVVVFSPGEAHVNPPVRRQAASNEKEIAGDWRVAFEPTMDNRWGDFRLPVTEINQLIGVEARRFAWAKETEELAVSAMRPETDDSAWATQLCGHGPKFYVLGPVPHNADASETDALLCSVERVDPDKPVIIHGEAFHWQPYDFSWRYGKEEDHGHQGFHGLKGTVSDNFIRLGKPVVWATHAIRWKDEERHRYYLWSTVQVAESAAYRWHISEPADEVMNTSKVNAPSAVFIDGRHVADVAKVTTLEKGLHRVLLRYDDCGESHVVLRRDDASGPANPTPLAMRWYNDPGVAPFDPFAGDGAAEWFRFNAPAGTAAIQMRTESIEPVQVWMNGMPMRDAGNGRFEAVRVAERQAVIAVRLFPPAGGSGGAALSEPIAVETSEGGLMPLGDWSKMGILNNYSGGVRYSHEFTMSETEAKGRVMLDLGRVIATAEVVVNSHVAGVRVAPPWRFDISACVKPGLNQVDIIIYNTLANHYQTSPSFFKGEPASGLFGPVKVITG
jgi:hypothetical protein